MDANNLLNNIKRNITLLGISPKMLGYKYLYCLFGMIIDGKRVFPLYRYGYLYLSNTFNKSVNSIDKAIQNAISGACNKENYLIYSLFGATIDENKGKPTNKHFIFTFTDKYINIL